MFQQLWLYKLDWDDPLPKEMSLQWQDLNANFHLFNQIRIPRWLAVSDKTVDVQLHGFSDASEKAYSAAVYIRQREYDGTVSVRLIAAKTKVAPLKKVCLPRLELCGAFLLMKLLKKVNTALSIPQVKLFGWTDSTIVLSWLSDEPARWKTFIANRTSFILDILPRNSWEHVPSAENPSDCASRGISPQTLLDFQLWWNGPAFLKESPEFWPKLSQDSSVNPDDLEIKQKPMIVKTATVDSEQGIFADVKTLFEKSSSSTRSVRVLAQCYRYMDILKTKTKIPVLLSSHITRATQMALKWSQHEAFPDDLKRLQHGQPLAINSKLASLCPFIDSNGILRVGGRIPLTTTCSYETRHPAILSKNHHFAHILISSLHLRHLHPTHNQLAAIVRQSYWIVGAKDLIRTISRRCTTCIRYRQSVTQQKMGDLPSYRITPSRPFSIVGVDFAGPINVKSKVGRGFQTSKGYIAVFVCLVVKAIHVEIVSDLTTEAFLACLRRFISRRGLPHHIYSDNGSNFIGAKRKLRHMYDGCLNISDEEVHSFLVSNRIEWSFIPPSSPHFGGMWEAGVKSVKRHLIRSIGETSLTFEEYSTLLSQIECLLNSRPIAPMDVTHTDNYEVLTPGHFIMGSSPLMLPEPPNDEQPRSITNRWLLVQNLMKGFWRIWRTDYLTLLQHRYKWKKSSPNITVDEIVLIRDDNAPPAHWPRGRVIEVTPGKDGLVRVVTVKTAKGTYKKPMNKVVRLIEP